jgi:branched-chain amino acid transport system permease protein
MGYFLDLLIIGLSVGMVYALIALGISFIYSGLDVVHFAHGEFYMFGAYFGLLLVTTTMPFAIAIVLSMAVTGLMGVIVERVFYRRLTIGGGGLSVAGMGMIICGFGMSVVLQNLAYLSFGASARRLPVDFGESLTFGEMTLPMSYLWIFSVSLLLMVVMHLFLKHTRVGLAVRAVAYSKTSASLMGINVPLAISVIFGVACALAAAGGVLASSVNYIHAQMGYVIGLKAFAAAVVGGLGSLPGAVIGGLVIGVTESLGAGYLSSDYKDVYAFLVLISVLMIRPSGFLGRIIKEKA